MANHTVVEFEAAGQFHRGDRIALRIARRMAAAARGYRIDQIRAALHQRLGRADAVEDEQRCGEADRCDHRYSHGRQHRCSVSERIDGFCWFPSGGSTYP